MAKVHHNTAKRAAKLGLGFVVDGDAITLIAGGTKVIATGTNAKDMLDAFVAKSNDEDDSVDKEVELEDEAGDEEVEDEDESRSIVKKKYKVAYKKFRNTCGDDMTLLMAKAVKHEVTVVTKGGKQKKVWRTDPARLKKLAKANGAWRDEYDHLNVGQQSMNVGNRLRKLAKDGVEIKWI